MIKLHNSKEVIVTAISLAVDAIRRAYFREQFIRWKAVTIANRAKERQSTSI